MGYNEFVNKNGYVSRKKKINNFTSIQSYKRTLAACTKVSVLSCYDNRQSIYLKYYFRVFKVWALCSHDSMKGYYRLQNPNMYESAFTRYVNGVFIHIDICKLFSWYDYFQRPEILDKLLLCGCDLKGFSFFDFLALRRVPLPDGKYLTGIVTDKGLEVITE